MKAVDLFAGAGGFSLGLRRAGFDVVLANEFSVDAEWTYRHNLCDARPGRVLPDLPDAPRGNDLRKHRAAVRDLLHKWRDTDCDGDRMRGGDIRKVLADDWTRSWRKNIEGEIDLVVAGPPCQGFSSAGKRDQLDDRNRLVDEALRVIKILRPRIAVIENVPGMVERHSDMVEKVGMQLSAADGDCEGYFVTAELVHGETLGVPQTRRRLLIIGVRRDLVPPSAHKRLHSMLFPVGCPAARPDEPADFGTPTAAGSTLTSSDLLGDLLFHPPEYGRAETWNQPYNADVALNAFTREVRALRDGYLAGELATDDAATTGCSNHEGSRHVADVARRMQMLRTAATASPDGREHRCSTSWLKAKFMAEHPELKTKKVSQRVLLADLWPMLTVTSLPDDIVHYSIARIPTVREVARLQTFPDWFAFHGVRTSGHNRRRAGVFVPQYTQVANAVPPRLAHAAAARLRQFLLRLDVDPSCTFELDGGAYETPNVGGTLGMRLAHLNEKFLEHGVRPASATAPGVDERVSAEGV